MMMGPEPMMRIFRRSLRFGIGRCGWSVVRSFLATSYGHRGALQGVAPSGKIPAPLRLSRALLVYYPFPAPAQSGKLRKRTGQEKAGEGADWRLRLPSQFRQEPDE